MVKGAMVWDDSARLAFLEEMVNRDILPKLPRDTATPAPAAGGAESEAPAPTLGGDDDF